MRQQAAIGLAVMAMVTLAGDPSWAAVCPRYWKPVCAMKDGAIKTYPNSACATADGATVVAGTASGGYCLRRGPFKRKR